MRSILPGDAQHAAVAEVDRERLREVRLAVARRRAGRSPPRSSAGVARSAPSASRASHRSSRSRGSAAARAPRAAVKRGGLPATRRVQAPRRASSSRRARVSRRVAHRQLARVAPLAQEVLGHLVEERAALERVEAACAPRAPGAGSRRSTCCSRYWKPQRAKVASRLAETGAVGAQRVEPRAAELRRGRGGHEAVVGGERASTSARCAARSRLLEERRAGGDGAARPRSPPRAHPDAVALAGGRARPRAAASSRSSSSTSALQLGAPPSGRPAQRRGRGHEEERGQPLAARARVGARVGQDEPLAWPGETRGGRARRASSRRSCVVGSGGDERRRAARRRRRRGPRARLEERELLRAARRERGGARPAGRAARAPRARASSRNGSGRSTPGIAALDQAGDRHHAEGQAGHRVERAHVHGAARRRRLERQRAPTRSAPRARASTSRHGARAASERRGRPGRRARRHAPRGRRLRADPLVEATWRRRSDHSGQRRSPASASSVPESSSTRRSSASASAAAAQPARAARSVVRLALAAAARSLSA